MSHRGKQAQSAKDARRLRKAYLEFADKFVYLLLDPANDWLRLYFYCDGFTYPIGSVSELAIDIAAATQRDSYLIPTELYEAVQNNDKEYLVEYVKRRLADTRPSADSLPHLLETLESRTLRKEMKKLVTIFQVHRGPKPKITREQRGELSRIANEIAPVIENILVEKSRNTKKTLDEMLDFWEKDNPEGCKFLRRNKLLFERACADPKLLARAKKLPNRARVLADALAGSRFGLSFRYSYDLLRGKGKPVENEQIAG